MADESDRPLTDSYSSLLSDLKNRISSAQTASLLEINQELIQLYWQIGKEVLELESDETSTEFSIEYLSQNLALIFPNVRSFSPRNLRYMREIAIAYPKSLSKSLLKLPWMHHQVLIDNLSSYDARLWYAQKALKHGWSHNILRIQIEARRLEKSDNGEAFPEPENPPYGSDLSRILHSDPDILSFTTLKTAVHRSTLHDFLVDYLGRFLLGLRSGFALVKQGYRLEVGDHEFFVDLLFYHVYLRRYIAISVETTEFKPEFLGTTNFQINAINDLLCDEQDEPTIGLVVCQSQDKTIVEYSLKSIKTPIGISTYQSSGGSPFELDNGLPTVEQLSAALDLAATEHRQINRAG